MEIRFRYGSSGWHVTPSPTNPALHVHVYEPLVSAQDASEAQLCVPVEHSSTLTHETMSAASSNPSAHSQVYPVAWSWHVASCPHGSSCAHSATHENMPSHTLAAADSWQLLSPLADRSRRWAPLANLVRASFGSHFVQRVPAGLYASAVAEPYEPAVLHGIHRYENCGSVGAEETRSVSREYAQSSALVTEPNFEFTPVDDGHACQIAAEKSGEVLTTTMM